MTTPSNTLPLAYLEGYTWFYGRRFTVSPSVLIPRPETEDIIHIAKQICSPTKTTHILDVGTGSGIIPITLALEIPNIQITATDISEKALSIARQNAKNLLPHPSINFTKSNLLQNLPKTQKFNIITANLPYVDPTWPWLDLPTLAHEPAIALFASDQGLALIKSLIDQAPEHLSPKGHLLLEADPCQHSPIIAYAKNHGLNHNKTQNYIIALTLDK